MKSCIVRYDDGNNRQYACDEIIEENKGPYGRNLVLTRKANASGYKDLRVVIDLNKTFGYEVTEK